jgi:hypothetical protein
MPNFDAHKPSDQDPELRLINPHNLNSSDRCLFVFHFDDIVWDKGGHHFA